MQTREFVQKVKQEANLNNDRDAIRAIEAVFRALHLRLPEDEADNVAATLPTELKDIWNGTIGQRLIKIMGVVERLNKEQFINRVQNTNRLGTFSEAEQKSKAVFHVLKEAIPEGESKDMEVELPPDLRKFWQDA